jgi:hypothetical protein
MKVITVLFTIILCLYACCSSEAVKDPSKEYGLKPYDPEKAGAVIVQSFDITDKIAPLSTEYFWTFYPGGERIAMKTNYNLAEYNNLIYIRIKRTLYVFDKASMQKQREIEINMPQEYDFLPSNRPGYGRNELAIIGSQAFMICIDERHPPWKAYLFNINLDTGNAQHINEEIFGVKLNNGHSDLIGYDQVKNVIWFRIYDFDRETSGIYFYYFQYDINTNTFTKIDEAVWNLRINWADYIPGVQGSRASILASSIYGNECWNVYEYLTPRHGEIGYIVIDRRNMDDLTVPTAHIDVLHLATLSLPQGIIYDKPYVWIMVEREGRIQMLKLLPHG